MWPLWESLSDQALVELSVYQWKNYGTKLDIITGAQDNENIFVEPLSEIDKIMRQPPSRSRGKNG